MRDPRPHVPTLCSQVYLTPDGSPAEYGSILVEINKRIKQDLVLSADLSSLYAMTQDKVGLWSLWGRDLGGPGHWIGLEGCKGGWERDHPHFSLGPQ